MRIPSPVTRLVANIQDPDTSNSFDKISEFFAVEGSHRLRPDADFTRARHQAAKYHGIACVSKLVIQSTITNGLAGHVPIDESLYDRNGCFHGEFSVSLDCICILLDMSLN
jgi:hypothetical protein